MIATTISSSASVKPFFIFTKFLEHVFGLLPKEIMNYQITTLKERLLFQTFPVFLIVIINIV